MTKSVTLFADGRDGVEKYDMVKVFWTAFTAQKRFRGS